MSRARLLFASVTLGSVLSVATLVACGGNVVFVEDGDGTGGSGASGPTTSGPTTSGPTTSGPGSSVTTNDSVSVVSSTGTGSFCDTGEQTSIDSFQCSNCVDCAQNDTCASTIEDCFADMACSAFVECLQNCQDDMCSQQCADQNPEGVQGYYVIIDCLVCTACPNNCDAVNNCPFQ